MSAFDSLAPASSTPETHATTEVAAMRFAALHLDLPSPRMSQAKERRKALRKLLLAGRGSTQGELCELLAARGLHTTQSTISRDLKLLGARRRIREDGSFVYRIESDRRAEFPAHMVLSVEHNEVQIVIRTLVGRAPVVGVELDALRHPDILGTLAGDDTVLVIPASTERIGALVAALRELSERS